MPVLDDLDQRLQRAAGPAPDPEAALTALLHRIDHPDRSRRLLLVAAIVLVVVGGGLVLARLGSGSPPSSVQSGPSSTVPGSTGAPTLATIATTTTTMVMDPPPGYVPVADHDGVFRGYMSSNDDLLPLPTFAVGSGEPLSGDRVIDNDGNQVGYLFVGIGFVSNEQASDPVEIDRLVAEYEARQREALELQGPTTVPTIPDG